MKEMPQISEAEYEVMKIVWKYEPITTPEVVDKVSKEPLPVEKVNAVIAACKEQGVIIGKNGATVAGFNNVLTLSPPLNIVQADLQRILDVVVESLKKL